MFPWVRKDTFCLGQPTPKQDVQPAEYCGGDLKKLALLDDFGTSSSISKSCGSFFQSGSQCTQLNAKSGQVVCRVPPTAIFDVHRFHCLAFSPPPPHTGVGWSRMEPPETALRRSSYHDSFNSIEVPGVISSQYPRCGGLERSYNANHRTTVSLATPIEQM
jgi:hypothetical protein